MTDTVTWLHISDTHFCKEKHSWDCKEIFDNFYIDLKSMEKEHGLIPDFIFYTGDIAFGQDNSRSLFLKDQYIEAQEFIEKVSNSFSRSIPKTNIFIVPGNHDVNRTQITPDQIEWIKNLQKNGKENASGKINDIIKSKNKQWSRYMERLEDYHRFLKEGGYDHLLDDPERLIYSKISEINGFKVGIIGLNSSWSSSSDGEKGNLWLGTYQILSSYDSIKDAIFSISLIHHPPNWFTEFEELDITRHIERMSNFCLHGHEHKEWITRIDNHIRISSGALYNGHRNENVYNFVRYFPEEYRGEIFLRKYDNGYWIPHIIGGKTDNNGIYNLEFLNISNLERGLNTGIKKKENRIRHNSNVIIYNNAGEMSSEITSFLDEGVQNNRKSKPSKTVERSQVHLKAFYSAEEYFSRYLEITKLLNHTYPFVGQDETLSKLDRFIGSEKTIALLVGRGGIGKSRILLEFGKNFESRHDEWKLRYLNENVSLTQDSIRELPDGNCVIVVDDAHRREDIATLLEVTQQVNGLVKIIMAFRPHGVNYVRNNCNKCGFDTRDIEEILEIQALKRAEKEELGKSILGKGHQQYLEALIQTAKDSTIVLVVGARLIAEDKVQPALLEQDEEFQETVFRRFKEDIISGVINEDLDATFCRDLLSIISILSPIQKDNEFIERTAKYFEVKKSKLNLSLDILEKSRVLHRIGSKLRITPSVLSDHILRNSCITSDGSSIEYAQEIFEAFGDVYLENILNNLSELDWRVTKQKRETNLLVKIWNDIVKEFKNSSNLDRAITLEKFDKIAYFQPQRTLSLIEYAINNPLKISDKNCTQLYEFTHKDVLGKIPALLKNISHNIEYLQQSCELLWYLVTNEIKQINPKSNNAMTVLVDLAKYEMYKPLECNILVLDFVERKLKCLSDYDCICSILDILDPMLEKEGLANRFTGVEVNFIPFSVPYESTKNIRQKAIWLIEDQLNCDSTKVVLRALKSLFEALSQPTGFFGKRVSDDEIKIWLPEQMEVLKIIENVSKTTTDPIVKIQIKSSLAWHSRQTNQSEVADKASSIIKSLPEDFDTKLMRAIWYHYDRDYKNFEENQKEIFQEIKEVAKEFLNKCNHEEKQIFDSLNEIITKFKVNEISIHPADFLTIFSTIDHKIACQVCNSIISNVSKPLANYLNALLSGIREKDEMMAIRIIEVAIDGNNPVICHSIAEGYAYRGWAFRLRKEEIKVVKKLLGSVEADTRNLAIKSLGYFPKTLMNEALELALNIEIGTDEKLADTYCSIFNERGISPEGLDNEQLKHILKKISQIELLDENLYHLNVFLAHCSIKIPEELIDLLLERLDLAKNVQYKEKSRFQPLPYDNFSEKGLNGIPLSSNYKKILRKVRDGSLDENLKDSFWLPRLYSYISENFSLTSLEILSEWINTGEEEKINAVSLLVKEAPCDFVFEHADFVSSLLTTAQLIGNKCYENVRFNVSYSVLCGVKTGIPGQACPQDENLRDKAQEFMKKYQLESPTWKFYNLLYKEAKGSINDWIKRDEEMMEE